MAKETIRIEITQSTVCGGEFVKKGEKIDAEVRDAKLLIALKKAVPATTSDKKKVDKFDK